MPKNTRTDPITRELIQNALVCAANEMAMALYRTAYSTIVRDALDFSTSLCNAKGEMIAQGKSNLKAPWLGLTAFCVMSIMLSLLIFVGEATRDAFDPRKTFR